MNHVKVKRKLAIIEFEDSVENEHEKIIEELVELVEHDFKSYVFEFTGLTDSLSSTSVGFIIAAVKKLMSHDSKVTIRNITLHDLSTLQMVGLVDFSKNDENLSILIRED